MTIPVSNASESVIWANYIVPEGFFCSHAVAPGATFYLPEGTKFDISDWTPLYYGSTVVLTDGGIQVYIAPSPFDAFISGMTFGGAFLFVIFSMWILQLLRRPVVET